MKKLLTLCLALAMTLSVGAYALTTLGSSAAKAADETATETSDTLTVKASEASGVFTTDMSSITPLTTSPAGGHSWNVMGMTKYSNVMTKDAKLLVKFDNAIDVSGYSYLNFKAMFWNEGGYGVYVSPNIFTTDNTDSGYNASILSSWNDKTGATYTDSSLWVSIPTSAIKKADGTVDGFIICNDSLGSGWFMMSDFTFENKCYTRIDYANTKTVVEGATVGVTVQSPKGYAASAWETEELRYRIKVGGKAFATTVRFASPIESSSVDYFYFKSVAWASNETYVPVVLKNINGEEVNTLDFYYSENCNGVLDLYLPADALKNESGYIEGFVLDGATSVPNLVFSDIVGKKGSPEPVADMLKSSATEGDFKRGVWGAIPPTTTDGLLYNGANINNGTINIVFKMPIKASVYKTIDFKALIWNGKDLKDVKISKPDGTIVETIKMKSGTTAEEYGDLNVKINAELLADENGLVSGFSMTMSNNKDGHLVFSAFTGNAEEKVYNATLTLVDGTQENIAYTASNRAAKLEEVKAKLGTDDAQYTYSHDLPAELPFEEGKTYTETRTVNKYNVTFKNYNDETLKTETLDYGATPVAPETAPVKPYDDDNHFTFKGWDKEIAAVTGDVTYTAEFDAVAHVYGEWQEVTAATCLEKGSHKKVCECGKEVVEETPAKGHTAVTDAAVAPTCTEPGRTEGSHCSVCNEVLTATQEIPAKGHTLEKVEAVAATESKEGVKEHYKCAECGKLFLDANGTTPATEADLKIAKLQSGGCFGSVSGLGFTFVALGMAFVALKKKRG